MAIDLILGTAGHIDHGKTSLTKALTGVDTDRLPEEKRRGITIELGFAQLDLGEYRLGMVDVPGHERFVRQMLAGATSMDLVMLVVAADDSVKQQTREHLDILRLLDLPAGVIALTKCDLAEPDWLELVEQDVRELVAGTFLADAPIVRTSAHTGEGLEELKAALRTAAAKAAAVRTPLASAPFRMAIDRAFTIAGHGTVVTGSVSTGRVRLGETLMLQPGGREVRVRGLQNHDQVVEEVHRGQRAAINLAGVHHDEVQRGQELAAPGHLVPSTLITARVSMLPGARPLKDRTHLRLHVGTAETMASARLVAGEAIRPGETGYVQLFLGEPVVVTWNQPLVLRSESPVTTIGGGRVLDPNAQRIRRADDAVLKLLGDLAASDEPTRAAAAAYFAGLRGFNASDLARTAGIADATRVEQSLRQRGAIVDLPLARGKTIAVHPLALEHAYAQISHLLAKLHEQSPLASAHPRAPLAKRLEWLGEPAMVDAIFERMQAAGLVKLTAERVALVGRGPKLSKGEQALLEQIVARYLSAGFQPPSVKEVQQEAAKNRDSVPQLVKLAAAEGRLVEFSQEYFLHADHERRARERLQEEFAKRPQGLTVSEIRELLGTTRKYAVPLCEYFDRIGFTRRAGDVRTLNERGVSAP